MKNTIMTILVALMVMAMVSMANATAYTIGDLPDTGAEYLVLTDTDGTDDDISVMGFTVIANAVTPWTVGIYEFITDNDGNATISYNSDGTTLAMLAVINNNTNLGQDSAAFDLSTGTASAGGNIIKVDETFGVYFTFNNGTDDTTTWYTHANLNDNADQYKIYDTIGLTGYGSAHSLLTNDHIQIGIIDASPAPVPEPATLLLLGSGLIGLAITGRKTNLLKTKA